MTELAEGLWSVTRPFRVIGVWLGTRMTVARLPSGGLVLHSPVAIDAEARAAVDRLGTVACIVAPSKVHNLFVPGWVSAYPEARLFGAPGLREKRKDLGFHGELDDRAPADFEGVFEVRLVRGAPLMNEVLFFHRPSKSLLVTDVAFNISASSAAWTRRYLKMMGAYGGFLQSRMVKLCVRDRRAVRESIDEALRWDFERVVVTHGDVLEAEAKPAFESVFSWL
jgi:hypothetical protein